MVKRRRKNTVTLKKAYTLSISIILTVFFVASYTVGSLLAAAPSEVTIEEEPKKSYSFTLAPADLSQRPKSLEPIESREEKPERSYTNSERFYDIPLNDGRQSYVFTLCEKYNLPCELVFGVMSAESEYLDGQISEGGDYGIMQINSINHDMLREELGVSDFLDFEQNVHCGIYMLSEYYHKYTDFNKIAMCYRYGEAGAMEMWKKGVYSTDYTSRVVRNIALLEFR